MKVLVAEDLKSVREHLSERLGEAGAVELRFVGQDASPLMLTVADWRPDVVILDIRMRGMMALEVLEVLKKEWPGVAVVVSAFIFQPWYRQGFLTLGADLVIDKSFEWEELIAFVHRRQDMLLASMSLQ